MTKILAVDYKPENLVLYEGILKQLSPGIQYFKAASGIEGIKIAQTQKPDTILLDVDIQDIDGFELCKLLKNDMATRTIPIVMITSSRTETKNRVKGMEMGADAFLSKPLDKGEFVATMKMILRNKAAADKLSLDYKKLEEFVRQRANDNKESDEKYATLFENNISPVLILDENNMILYANKSANDFLGLFSAKDTNSNFLSFIDRQFNQDSDEIEKLFINNGNFSAPFNIKGNAKILEISLSNINLYGKNVKFIIGKDITENIKIEKELTNFKLAIESSIDGISVQDKKGNFIFINQAYTHLYGYNSVKELLDKNWRILYPAEEIKRFETEVLERLNKIGHWRGEVIGIRKDGTIFPQEVSLTKLESGNTIAVVHDISKRKKIEEELREKHNLLVTIMNNTQDGIYIKDIDGKYLMANKSALAFMNKSGEELIGKNSIDVFGEENGYIIEQNDQKILQNGVAEVQEEFIDKDNQRRIFSAMKNPLYDSKGKINGIIGISRDVTEARKAQETIRKAHDFYLSLFDNLPIMIWRTNKEGVEDYVNRAWEIFTGASKNEILEKGLKEFFHPEDYNIASEADKDAFPKRVSYQIKYRARRHDRKFRWIRDKAAPFYDMDGNFGGYVGACTDITDLLEAKEKAEESEKLKTSFLTNMSHEIRTPMNAIIGFSGLLTDKSFTDDQRNNFGTIISNSCESLLQLIDDILDISILESKQMEIRESAFSLHDLFRDLQLTFNETKSKFDKDNLQIKYLISKSQTDINLISDKVRFQQILSNLLSNSLKYSHKGTISFGWEVIDNNEIKIFVKDTGIGISVEKLPVIFERFRKIDSDREKLYGGAGLGLSICKSLVQLLGGEIWVESEFGVGSTFYFTVPMKVAKKQQLQDNTKTENTNIYDWKGKVVLIVEDVQSNFQFLEVILKKTNVKILWAKDGRSALNYINENQEICLVLMDIQLPDISGYEATKKIKEIRPDLPVIAQTAYAMEDEIYKSRDAGCDDYIPKPIKAPLLKEIIDKFIKNAVR